VKHRVSELEGALLDAAVAKAAGQQEFLEGCSLWAPSDDWSQGGPIIERERIDIVYWGRKTNAPWRAGKEIAADSDIWTADLAMAGPTPLIAAMRAFCASKFGEEVELP
jgi:hypothetical protein